MEAFRIKITNTQSAGIEIQPCSDGSVDIVVRYGTESQNNTVSSQNKPFKFHNKENHTVEELVNSLRQFCSKKIKEEPEWKEDIIKFGKFYSERVKEGWKGELRINDLYKNWCDKRK